MDLTSGKVRSCESGFANFVNDILVGSLNADVVLLPDGCLRSNKNYNKGHVFTIGDLFEMFPYDNPFLLH